MLDPLVQKLVDLSHRLGDPAAELAILAEGNVSAKIDDSTFWVKASGTSLGTIEPTGFVQVKNQPILDAMNTGLADDQVRTLLAESRVDTSGPTMPSVETFMHAFLLTLPDVSWVGHTHPTPLLSLLSLSVAEDVSKKRLYPDEIVCCGPATAFVPYVDPGLPLATAVRDAVLAYANEYGSVPKTVWMQNHGLIVLGRNTNEIVSASLMSVKAAKVWLGALSSGCELHSLTPEQVERIHTRPDEHYRQRLLWALQER